MVPGMTTNETQTGTESDSNTQTRGSHGPSPRAGDSDEEGGENERRERSGRAELLAEENRRLRAQYARAMRTQYRQTAVGLAAIAAAAFVTGLVFPEGRQVFFAFGFTGLFGSVLTLYLTPTSVVTADVGERIYRALATNEKAIATQLGVDNPPVYIPGSETVARLYIPRRSEYDLPNPDEGPLVVDDASRGLLLEATGSYLFDEFRQSLSGELATAPGPLAAQLTDGLVEQFEIAEAAEVDLDQQSERVTVRLSGSTFGDVDHFDHPIPSFLATGLVAGLEQPVTVEVQPTAEYADWLVTCRWNLETRQSA